MCVCPCVVRVCSVRVCACVRACVCPIARAPGDMVKCFYDELQDVISRPMISC